MPRRGKVLIFVHDLRASGVVRNTLAIAERIAERHQVRLVARNIDGLLAEDAARFDLQSLANGPIPLARAAARLRRIVRAEQPDVLLSTGNRGHAVVVLALAGLRLPLPIFRISNSVATGRSDAGLRGLWARLLAKRADHLFLVGTATGRSRTFSSAVASGCADVITNGVDVARARRLAQAPPPPSLPPGGPPVVLAVGRLAPQKDFPTLVRAAAIAAKATPLRLAIVGKGEEAARAELRRIASAEGFSDADFLLPGETDNVFPWLATASAFVLPSRWEGSSMALLEALAVDVPIVATRQAGDAAHVLDDGRYGLLVDAGDPPSMAAAILRQLSDSPVRPRDRAKAFSVEAAMERYATAIDASVERAQNAGR